jgi:predicted 3-demethylubiquinone-9 3-methyltransferase (glyoxalase superfamily)
MNKAFHFILTAMAILQGCAPEDTSIAIAPRTEMKLTDGATNCWYPSPAWNGSSFGVAWSDSFSSAYQIYLVVITSSPANPAVKISANGLHAEEPSLVWADDEYGVAWQDNRNGEPEIFFARIDSAGNKIGDEKRISGASDSSERPCAAWNGIAYGVVWVSGQTGRSQIFFATVDINGNILPRDMHTDDSNSSDYPSLAWAGDRWAFAWQAETDRYEQIYLATTNPAGVRAKDIWTGIRCAVTWKDCRNSAEEIYLAY